MEFENHNCRYVILGREKGFLMRKIIQRIKLYNEIQFI